MAIHHSTEYSLDGGAWVMAVADEEAGPGKSFEILGLDPGSYSTRLRITPLTGGGPAVISTPFTLVVEDFSDVGRQIQSAQVQAVSAGLAFIASVAQSQTINSNAATATLQFTALGSQAQPAQSQSASASGIMELTGTVAQTQLVQVRSGSGALVFYATMATTQSAQTSTANATNTPLAAPTISVTSGTALQVVLDWADVSGATAYDVYRHTSTFTPPGTGTKVGSDLAVSTFTELTTAAQYFYRVIAKNSGGSSAASNEVNVTTAGGGVTAVSDTFTRANSGTLGSNWTQLTGTAARWSVNGNAAVASGESNGDYWSADPVAANHYSEGNSHAVAVRMQVDAHSCYAISTDTVDEEGWITTTVKINRVVNGAVAAESTAWQEQGEGISVFDGIWRLEATGTTVVLKTATAHNDNGTTGYTTRITWTESTLSNGAAGLYYKPSTALGTSPIDNWYGGDIV